MAKLMSVKEALELMQAKEGKNGKKIPNRFNKKNFTTLMTAMANDPEFSAKVVKLKKGEIDSVENVMVSKGFREFCKRVVEKAGVDKTESARVLTSAFTFTNADMAGLYDFFATALYEYMNAGNWFEFIPTETFKASIALKDVAQTETTAEAFSPKDRSSLGVFKTTKKQHKELRVKSGCPSFLKDRKRV